MHVCRPDPEPRRPDPEPRRRQLAGAGERDARRRVHRPCRGGRGAQAVRYCLLVSALTGVVLGQVLHEHIPLPEQSRDMTPNLVGHLARMEHHLPRCKGQTPIMCDQSASSTVIEVLRVARDFITPRLEGLEGVRVENRHGGNAGVRDHHFQPELFGRPLHRRFYRGREDVVERGYRQLQRVLVSIPAAPQGLPRMLRPVGGSRSAAQAGGGRPLNAGMRPNPRRVERGSHSPAT